MVSFSCFNFKEIFSIAGEYMIKKYYSGIYKMLLYILDYKLE